MEVYMKSLGVLDMGYGAVRSRGPDEGYSSVD